MKKILSLLGTIALTGTSTTSLVACNKPAYTETQLKELKEKNKINIKNQTIRDNLEGIAPQEKVFNEVDNKGYFAIGRGIGQNNITNGRIIKFKHDELKNKTIDSYDIFKLNLIGIGYPFSWGYDIGVENHAGFSAWGFEAYTNIKSVYRGNGSSEPQTPEIDAKTGKITNGKN